MATKAAGEELKSVELPFARINGLRVKPASGSKPAKVILQLESLLGEEWTAARDLLDELARTDKACSIRIGEVAPKLPETSDEDGEEPS